MNEMLLFSAKQKEAKMLSLYSLVSTGCYNNRYGLTEYMAVDECFTFHSS